MGIKWEISEAREECWNCDGIGKVGVDQRGEGVPVENIYIRYNSKGEIIQKSKRNWIYTCGICHGKGWIKD